MEADWEPLRLGSPQLSLLQAYQSLARALYPQNRVVEGHCSLQQVLLSQY